VGVAALADALDEIQGNEAVGRLLRPASRLACRSRDVGRGELAGQVGGEELEEVGRFAEEPAAHHGDQFPPFGDPAAAPPRLARLVAAKLLLLGEDHFELEIRVRHQRRQRDQFGEQMARRAALRRTPTVHAAVGMTSHDPAPARDGKHQAEAVQRQQRPQLGAHGADVAGLHLEQHAIGNDVDDVSVDQDLEPAAGGRHVALERSVKRRFVEQADGGHSLRIPAEPTWAPA
jgi:hypothetical protein